VPGVAGARPVLSESRTTLSIVAPSATLGSLTDIQLSVGVIPKVIPVFP
jgi:hypothetical protein